MSNRTLGPGLLNPRVIVVLIMYKKGTKVNQKETARAS